MTKENPINRRKVVLSLDEMYSPLDMCGMKLHRANVILDDSIEEGTMEIRSKDGS